MTNQQPWLDHIGDSLHKLSVINEAVGLDEIGPLVQAAGILELSLNRQIDDIKYLAADHDPAHNLDMSGYKALLQKLER